MFEHATIADDVTKNPMLLVNMLAASEFEKKEIRYFTEEECALLIEESSRQYSTGKLVYQYADAYVLMLNTGIRLGEAIGLKKTDWDKKEKTLHIQRNIQSISKRDTNGNRIKGKQLVTNTTKTYSGDRILPLNKAATEALERLCEQHPNSEYIVCSSKGEIIPPERLERTFYRILKNVGICQAGTHSLRHTFASVLFAKGTDVKTVSELLGHASIQITLNTYVHLIGKPKHNAVAKLDDAF
jgi:integrase